MGSIITNKICAGICAALKSYRTTCIEREDSSISGIARIYNLTVAFYRKTL